MLAAGQIADNTTGNVACDMYNRWQEDIALMKSLGIKNYRCVGLQAGLCACLRGSHLACAVMCTGPGCILQSDTLAPKTVAHCPTAAATFTNANLYQCCIRLDH